MIREFCNIKPEIDPTSYIHKTAEVIGKVKIGKEVSIWPGAVLRGDVEQIIIGDKTNIQDGVLIHTDYGFPTTIGKNVVVGHGVIIHGCKIGNDCLIGMGAIILNGTVVEDNCIIGAGSVVTENTRVNSGKLALGVPAKIVRDLREEEILQIRKGVEHYIEKIKEYCTGQPE